MHAQCLLVFLSFTVELGLQKLVYNI
jgi:hypothetical protein